MMLRRRELDLRINIYRGQTDGTAVLNNAAKLPANEQEQLQKYYTEGEVRPCIISLKDVYVIAKSEKKDI